MTDSADEESRGKACRRAIFRWFAWTGLFGGLPVLMLFIFRLVDFGRPMAPADLFQRGDALLIGIAFFASGMQELYGIARNDRPDVMDVLVPITAVLTVLSAALFGYMWPRVGDGTITPLQKDALGWVSLVVLAIGVAVGMLCSWLSAGIKWEKIHGNRVDEAVDANG